LPRLDRLFASLAGIPPVSATEDSIGVQPQVLFSFPAAELPPPAAEETPPNVETPPLRFPARYPRGTAAAVVTQL
jgi:hypothetical protein